MSKQVYIVGSARTPIASFLGSLSSLTAPQLGATAIRAALEHAGLSADAIDECYMGNVLSAGVGQAPARQAAKGAGLPNNVPATTINKVCGSGLQSIIMGQKAILLDDAELVVAGGMESMSNAPYILPKARSGYRMGNGEVIDTMVHDGLWDPYGNMHMGHAGELCARECNFSRQVQDDFTKQSYERALHAQTQGWFKEEIVPVTVTDRKGDTLVSEDEEPGRARLDKLSSLRPVFDKDGTITAANASSVNDGAAAVVLASEEAVKRYKLQPLARLVAYAGHAQAPEWFTTAPVGATEKVLARAQMKVDDIDLFEINEAFAVVALACMQKSGIDPEKTNVFGGAVALGHPIGATGTRLVVTLLSALGQRGKKRGLATLCIGGGEALALIVERV
ncbi:MAG: thiolase family protein [Myxococcales bacterium]|nr:MAG: thiolase family protein [Myxococcales bacterium]